MRQFPCLCPAIAVLLLSFGCASTGGKKDPQVQEIPDPIRCKADVGPIRITGPMPGMSEEARRQHKRTEVLVEALVRPDGTVQVLRVLEGPEPDYGLKDAAARAVSQWIYRPALRDGQPIECTLTIKMPFPPPRP